MAGGDADSDAPARGASPVASAQPPARAPIDPTVDLPPPAPRLVPTTEDLPGRNTPFDPGASNPPRRGAQRAGAAEPGLAARPRSTMAFDRGGAPLEVGGAAGTPGPGLEPVAGRYHDRGLIACGAMGEVRRVWDARLGTHHAIKVMLPRLARRPQARARFAREIRITASLNHPGIVSVVDQGELPDGRLWYVMDEVSGETLSSVMLLARLDAGGVRPDPTSGAARRLIAAFEQLCQAVASAHQAGVVHRDLKPDNVMIGRFGEVRVMDWGLARARGEAEPEPGAHGAGEERGRDPRATQAGHVLGTPIYMAPEQAAGETARIGPHSDVYALGIILFELIAGEAPWSASPGPAERAAEPSALERAPDAPRDLCAIAARAMRVDPAGRYPTAAEMAEEVAAWLDGARRRAEALVLVAQAAALQPDARAALEVARARVEAARAALHALPDTAAIEEKAPLWAAEDEALRGRRLARLRLLEVVQGARAALNLVPDLPEGHRLLAQHYADRLIEAEQEGRVEDAAEVEELLKEHDRGQHSALIRGAGRVRLQTAPAGAAVIAWRFVERGRRLDRVCEGVVGETPLQDLELPRGSYLLELRAPGFAPAWVGVRLGRLEVVDFTPPGRPPAHLPLLPLADADPGVAYVPAGWTWSGGDPLAVDALPGRRLWIDGFVVQRAPVQVREWAAWVEARWGAGAPVDALLPTGAGLTWEPDARGCPRPPEAELGLPIRGVSIPAMHGYAAWLAEQTGVPWRLPHDQEWEKAARGVDGRAYPWGDHFDPAWAVSATSGTGPPRPLPTGAHPGDEGPFGLLDAAGNLRQACRNRYHRAGPPAGSAVDPLGDDALPTDPFAIVRGGSFTSMAFHCRAAGRFIIRPTAASAALTVRLVASVGDGAVGWSRRAPLSAGR